MKTAWINRAHILAQCRDRSGAIEAQIQAHAEIDAGLVYRRNDPLIDPLIDPLLSDALCVTLRAKLGLWRSGKRAGGAFTLRLPVFVGPPIAKLRQSG